MPPTLKEFQKFQREKTTEEHAVNLELLKVAAVKATDLTGHPGWDRFLEQCQALLEDAEQNAIEWSARCVQAINTDAMREAQRQAGVAIAEVELLKRIMQLPNKILKEYRSANGT